MPSKGASNRYTNKRRKKSNNEIGYKWAKGFNKNTLNSHFAKHKKDFNSTSAKEYSQKAVAFANTINDKHCISFVDKNNTTTKYNSKTNTFAQITKKGVVITFFKPKNGKGYYNNVKRKAKIK